MKNFISSKLVSSVLLFPVIIGLGGIASSLAGCAVETPKDPALTSDLKPAKISPDGGNGSGNDGYGDDGYGDDGYR